MIRIPSVPKVHLTDAPTDTLLAVYLQDHLAGAMAGLQLARRSFANNRGTSYELVLRDLVHDIGEDADELHRLMEHLGVEPSRAKQALAVGAEYAGRAKLNGQLRGYSPLSRVVELEGLIGGVSAKQRLWQSLQAGAVGSRLPASIDVAALQERAESQLGRLHELHVAAAGEAFADGPAGQR